MLVKPNVGGSGALIERFDSAVDLEARAHALDFGPDGTALLQQYVEPLNGAVVRVEVLDGRLLYAIRIVRAADDFNLCARRRSTSVVSSILWAETTARHDVNATSNFVANAPDVLGFDPFHNFADHITRRAI